MSDVHVFPQKAYEIAIKVMQDIVFVLLAPNFIDL